MNFENFVRPFQTKRVLTVERVVTVRPAVADDPAAAILTWGAVGAVPEGVLQENKGRDLMIVGFNTRCNPVKWRQSGTPVTEEVAMPPPHEDVHVNRVREISFKTVEKNSSDSNHLGTSSVAAGVRDVIEGLRADISANRSCESSYKTTWD